MHNAQHNTRPGVALFYLHPTRRTVDMSWNRVFDERAKIYNLIASMVAWSNYDEAGGKGLKPPGDVTWCGSCKWNKGGQREQRLGPKQEGHRDNRWRDLGSNEPPAEPVVSSQHIAAAQSEHDSESISDIDIEALDASEDNVSSLERVQVPGAQDDLTSSYTITLPNSKDGEKTV